LLCLVVVDILVMQENKTDTVRAKKYSSE